LWRNKRSVITNRTTLNDRPATLQSVRVCRLWALADIKLPMFVARAGVSRSHSSGPSVRPPAQPRAQFPAAEHRAAVRTCNNEEARIAFRRDRRPNLRKIIVKGNDHFVFKVTAFFRKTAVAADTFGRQGVPRLRPPTVHRSIRDNVDLDVSEQFPSRDPPDRFTGGTSRRSIRPPAKPRPP
jgi:hypothetical protein